MNSKPLTIEQLKEARQLRNAFQKTGDGIEAVPTPLEFAQGIAEMDEQAENIQVKVEKSKEASL